MILHIDNFSLEAQLRSTFTRTGDEINHENITNALHFIITVSASNPL